MKKIFEWMRERVNGRHGVYIFGQKYVNLDRMNEIINEAEAKWEAEVCEWKYEKNKPSFARAVHDIPKLVDEIRYWKFCPYCGKPIKISEVE